MDRNIEKISLGNKHSVVWIHDVGEKQKRPLNGPFLNIEEGEMFFYGSIWREDSAWRIWGKFTLSLGLYM